MATIAGVSYTLNTVAGLSASDMSVDAVNDLGTIAGSQPTNYIDQGGLITMLPGGIITGINDRNEAIGTNFFYDGHGNVTLLGDEAPTAINNFGTVVGSNVASFGGFVFSGGVSTPLNVPGASYTHPTGINDLGEIVGSYALPGQTNTQGFTFQNGAFTSISFPGARESFLAGVNDFGEVVGNFVDPSGNVMAFTYQNGQYNQIVVPGATFAEANAINAFGTVVGDYMLGPDRHGLILHNGQVSTFDVPGASDTILTGINNLGEVVGIYDDSSGQHGFTAIPADGFDFSSITPPTVAAATDLIHTLEAQDPSLGSTVSAFLQQHGIDPTTLQPLSIPS